MVWTGPRGVATLWAFDGPNAILHADITRRRNNYRHMVARRDVAHALIARVATLIAIVSGRS